MLRVTLKGMRGHLVRFLLTALAVTLGVAFVAGSFVLRDSMNATLDNLLTSASKGLDVEVRGTHVTPDGPRRPVTIALADRLATVPGVARSLPGVQGSAMIVGKDGIVVRNGGAPTLGFAFRPDDPSFQLISGHGPAGPDEIVVEKVTLEKSGLAIGDTTKAVIGAQARSVRIAGEVTFGSLFGATAVLVDEASARAAFSPDGNIENISLTAAPGVSQEDLRARVARVLPAGAEARTGQKALDDSRSAVQSGLSVFTTFLLVFAGITLFVGAFIIVNTFSIVLAQRTRELALLRAVGASRGQIRRMVVGEAAVIGLIGSALGIVVGAGLAAGLKTAIKATLGAEIGGGLPVHGGTVAWSVAVGVLVTVVAALLPARRAARTPPVAAMRDDMVAPPSSIRRRGAVGVVVFALGAGLLVWGVSGTSTRWLPAGVGAALTLLGALLAAPLAARPVVRVIVWPFLRLGGVVGRLAGQNALRVPRRTANTASALMIGLTLVAGLAVVASSTKASFAGIISDQLTADYVLSSGGQAPVPAEVAHRAAALPGVRAVAELGYLQLSVAGHDDGAVVATSAGLTDNVRFEVTSGSAGAIDRGQVLVDETRAKREGWRVGSGFTATVGTLAGKRLTVGGVFKDNRFLDVPFVLGPSQYAGAVPTSQQQDFMVLIKAASGADTAALRTALTDLVKPYLVVSVQTGSEYVDSTGAQVDQLVNLLYVLLALAIVIAVLGIVNTLALSVVERTREIGLLRAVGLARRQLSGMITIEAVATAVFGAVLGTALGVGLGAAFQHGLRGDGLDVLQIPWTTIVTVLVSAAVVGVVAAVMPAVRAVRLNILQAIATD